nr:hypothetical protein [Tanacetum cinerariifolium]
VQVCCGVSDGVVVGSGGGAEKTWEVEFKGWRENGVNSGCSNRGEDK